MHIFPHLGIAPFRYLGYQKRRFCAPGEPPRAGATCDHCGTAIAYCFLFRSADGRRFKVGSTCVGKSGDAGLKRAIASDVAKHRRETAKARADVLFASALAALATEPVRAALAAQPHPSAWAAAKGLTLLDSVEWLLMHAGQTGRTKIARLVLRVAT
mgnify:CR=1 FL=1